MANTENIEAKLCAYVDGDLDAAGRLEIEKHLAANPQHRGLIEQLSKQRDLLRELPRESAPEEILEALQSQMERSVLLGDADAAAEAGTLKIQRWPQLMAAAAIVLLTIGLGAVIYMVLPRTGGGDASYAVTTTRGATLEDRKVATIPDAAPGDGSSALDGAGEAVVRSKSAEPSPDALTASPAVPEVLAKDKAADIFAPNAAARAGGELAIAANDLLDAQNRLQNADLAKQLKEAPGGLDDNAMFVVVHTADPSAARSEVTKYLASNKIAWDSVAHPVPEFDALAGQSVSLSRAQSVHVQRKSGEVQVEQQQGAQPTEAQKKAEASTGSGTGSAGAGAGVVEQKQQPPAAPAQQRREEMSGVADATQQLGQRAEILSNTAAPDPALLEATSQPEQQPQPQQQQQLAQQPFHVQQLQLPARDGQLIIARGMTKQQAAELSSNLSKQTTVQRAAVYEQRPIAARVAAPVLQRTRDLVVPTTGPTTATTAPAPDEFARELAAATPTTVPATQQVVLDAAPTKQEAAQPTTTTAPAPTPLGTSDASTFAEPATQPAVSGALDNERVDVVILVQDDEAPAAVIEPTETEVPSAPNAAPTTNPAATTPTAPSTQPAPELTF